MLDNTSEQFTVSNDERISDVFHQLVLQTISKTIETSWQTRVAARISSEVDVGIDIKWGGEKGIEIGGRARGEVRDDNGNYGTVEITQNSDGTGEANISAGHKED